MRRTIFTLCLIGATCGALIIGSIGCPAGEKSQFDDDDASGGSGAVGNSGGTGGLTMNTGGESTGGQGGTVTNPCGSECGDTELCDSVSVGLDDDCDNVVDEGCDCTAGTAQACFKGDPSYLSEEGCYPGTQKCTELGVWGDCIGGVHVMDGCFEASAGCHPMTSVPFVTVNLKDGTGTFSSDAVTETWEVACPTGVDPCPSVTGSNPMDDYTPLQSGEYTVTYTKTTASGDEQCVYPLFIGAPGLRVELTWEHPTTDDGVDLDLHVHKPNDSGPWGGDMGNAVDCAYDNCTYLAHPFLPAWFTAAAPPDPVAWYLDPVSEKNTCYYGPNGSGAGWQFIGLGCHNPRLDSDNISCDATITDPQDYDFCNPENINIDYPPKKEWTRIGVHYFSAHGLTYDVHPVVKIFCQGRLAAEFGPQGFYNPSAPVTFNAADGDTLFWLVADVAFLDDQCDQTLCKVEPIFQVPQDKTPLLSTTSVVTTNFGPPYPPPIP